MKICVITKCDDWADDVLELHGSQWRQYTSSETDEVRRTLALPKTRVKGIKVRPFYRGEILFLNDHYNREIGPERRAPYKWGVEERHAARAGKKASRTQFRICKSLKEAVELARSIGNE